MLICDTVVNNKQNLTNWNLVAELVGGQTSLALRWIHLPLAIYLLAFLAAVGLS